MRLLLEVHPDWVIVRLDLRNAFNEICRSKVLERLNQEPHLRSLVPLSWATYVPESSIFLGTGQNRADFLSAEGMQQGDGVASAGFCVGIHPEVKELDAEVGAAGGAARFDMDDGYVVGPPAVVFPAVLRFAERISDLGLELQLDKSECYSPSGAHSAESSRPSVMPWGQLLDENEEVLGYGVPIAGVPVGDAGFIREFMDRKVRDVLSNITTVTDKLQDRHLQSLYSSTLNCLNPKFQYWLQHCYPADVHEHAARIDQSILATVGTSIHTSVIEDAIALQRLRLPARMYGGGMRSLVDVTPAAFIGGMCRSLPFLLDKRDEDWNVQPGFLPQLAEVLGRDAFGDPASSTWFAGLLRSALPLSTALRQAWEIVQAGADAADGVLAVPASRAGAGLSKVQKELTHHRETVRFTRLDAVIRALPEEDMRRSAWMNLDKNSTVWVTAWPTRDAYLANPEFAEVATFYFGLASPACINLVGERIGRSSQVLDSFGNRLTSVTLPGDGWRKQHDAIKWRIQQDAREMMVRHRTEVYGLFSACMPQRAREAAAAMPARKRQGLVPDFSFHLDLDGPERELLFELKTLHIGSTTYQPSGHRCDAVARRARALPAEYSAKARRLDQQFCGASAGQVGPVEAKLRSFDPVRGIVFGAFGEGSPDVERLISAFAKVGAARHWQGMLATSPQEAIGVIAWMLRRRWAMTALRENARLKLERLEYVGRGAALAADRRAAVVGDQGAAARRAACRFWQGPRHFNGHLDS